VQNYNNISLKCANIGREWFAECDVQKVLVFELLEALGFVVFLVNARDDQACRTRGYPQAAVEI
jgi:hypothetical protein